MSIIKDLLQTLVTFFFKIFFLFFKKPKLSAGWKSTFKLYEDDASFKKLFQTIRLWDAPYERLEKYIPQKGTIIDIGCGDGLFANYLAISGSKRKVIGIDINRERIKQANKSIKNTKFSAEDVSSSKIPKADAILFIHVLHHFKSKKVQEKILSQSIKKLNKGGNIIIVEISEKPFAKYIFTWLIDVIAVPILFEGKAFNFNINYRKTSEWKKLFTSKGLNCKVIVGSKGKPFSHVIYICDAN